MVGHYAERNVGLVVVTVLFVGKLSQFLNQRLEHVGVVIRFLALNSHAEALETHAGINMLGGQRHQLARCQTIELHENEVPDFNHQRIILVNEGYGIDFLTLVVIAEVDVDFGARAARTGIAHLPKIILFIPIKNTIFW